MSKLKLKFTIENTGDLVSSELSLDNKQSKRFLDCVDNQYGLDINGNKVESKIQAQMFLDNVKKKVIDEINAFERERKVQAAIADIDDIPGT